MSLVGGKGANLARMFQAGFAVPPGFLISTQAYRDFIQANQLETAMTAVLSQSNHVEMAALETAAEAIRAMFTKLLAAEDKRDWKSLINQRRNAYQRDLLRRIELDDIDH